MTTFTTYPVALKSLMNSVETGHIQLPEFSEAGYGTTTGYAPVCHRL